MERSRRHPGPLPAHPRHYMTSRLQSLRLPVARRTRAAALALLVLSPCVLFAKTALPGSEPKGAAHKEVEHLEQEWRSAILAGDTAAMGAMMADSYIGIGPDGTIATKPQTLELRADGKERLDQLQLLDRKIRLYGTTAVVTSRVRLQGVYSGEPLMGEYRYTRVWSFSHGQWRIVSFEANRIHDASARSH